MLARHPLVETHRPGAAHEGGDGATVARAQDHLSAMAFPLHLLEEIRARLDIVELIGGAVNLRRAGENWKGLCPFHTEKTPSFTVNVKRGIFHCFGCHAGGDAFGFIMRQERLAFPDAVRLLAQRAGVELPSGRPERPEAEGRLDALRRIMAAAAEFYAERLWGRDGTRARAYLESRGIEAAAARRFGLGYAPEGWDVLLAFMRGRGIGDGRARPGRPGPPAADGHGLLRPLPGAALVPHPRRAGTGGGLRGPRHGRRGTEVPQLARDLALQQGPDAVRARSGAGRA